MEVSSMLLFGHPQSLGPRVYLKVILARFSNVPCPVVLKIPGSPEAAVR